MRNIAERKDKGEKVDMEMGTVVMVAAVKKIPTMVEDVWVMVEKKKMHQLPRMMLMPCSKKKTVKPAPTKRTRKTRAVLQELEEEAPNPNTIAIANKVHIG